MRTASWSVSVTNISALWLTKNVRLEAATATRIDSPETKPNQGAGGGGRAGQLGIKCITSI